MASILVRDVELFFRAKLEAQLGGAHEFVTGPDRADLAIVDVGRVDPAAVVSELAPMPMLGFTNHTNTEGLRAAHQAGFDRVVIRSVISQRAPELVVELLKTAGSSERSSD
jgi:hypothetical protein